MGAKQEMMVMFGGLNPSRGALDVVGKALQANVDPSFHIGQAVEQTLAAGKSKVCVKPGSPLESLRKVVATRQQVEAR